MSLLWLVSLRISRLRLVHARLVHANLISPPPVSPPQSRWFSLRALPTWSMPSTFAFSFINKTGGRTQVLLFRRYSESPTYEWIPFKECLHKSNKANLGTQLTQLTIQYYTVIVLQDFSHKNTEKITDTKNKETFLTLQYNILKSTVGHYNTWHPGAGIKWTGKKSYCLEEGEEVGDGRAEGSSGCSFTHAWRYWQGFWFLVGTRCMFASLKACNLKVPT